MNFAELLDSWISEKILRSQTDLSARVAKLEMRVAELENQAVNHDTVRDITNEVVQAALDEAPQGSLTESRVKDLIYNTLSEDVDWDEMIGDTVNDRVEIWNENQLYNEIKAVLDDVEFRVTVR